MRHRNAPTQQTGLQERRRQVSFGIALVFGAGFWTIITDGAPGSWIVGLPTVVAAAFTAAMLGPRKTILPQLRTLVSFAGYFTIESLRGGWDIAYRAYHPRLPLNPGTLEITLYLPPGRARNVFTGVLNLLPGTLLTRIEGNRATIHCVDIGRVSPSVIRDLEARVATLFGVELPDVLPHD